MRGIELVGITALLAGGCGFSAPVEAMWDAADPPSTIDAKPIDAPPPIDSSIDASPALCFGGGMYTVCVPELPTSDLGLGTQVVTTDPGVCPGTVFIPGTGKPSLCVMAGRTVTVTGRFEARGSLPLVLIATAGNLQINSGASIDVSSRAGVLGAGANFSGCTNPTPAASSSAGGGGGAGGTFGTRGGNGGDNTTAPGGNASTAIDPVTFLRGGCRGGRGGNGNTGNGGEAGNGGGAVYLLASGVVIVAGDVNASGEAGGGGQASKGGGGGGGSGGMIALWGGTNLSVAGQLWANGGGGGGGSGNSSGARGGESASPGSQGASGIGDNGEGTNGGQGAVGTNVGDTANNAAKGAGGAGGGVGVLVNVSGHSLGGTYSPAPQ